MKTVLPEIDRDRELEIALSGISLSVPIFQSFGFFYLPIIYNSISPNLHLFCLYLSLAISSYL